MADFGMAGSWGFPKLAEVQGWFGKLDFSQDHGGRANWADFQSSLAGAVERTVKAGLAVHLTQPMFLAGGTLAAAARGDYDSYWRGCFKNVATKLGGRPSVLRIGPEQNGSWMPWRAETESAGKVYGQAFARAASIARQEIPGVRIDWNVNRDTPAVDFRWSYPGDGACDIISIDFYFENEYSGGLSGRAFFDKILNEKNGIAAVRRFAAERGKPFAYAEFGAKSVSDQQGAEWIDALTTDLRTHPAKAAFPGVG